MDRDPAALQRYLDRYPPDIVILTHYWREIAPHLQARGWIMVHTDDWAFIMVPQRPDTAELIQHEAYRWLKSWEKVDVTPAIAAQVLKEAERAIRHCPQDSNAAQAFKVNALQALGRTDEWREAHRQLQAARASRGYD